MFLENYRMTEPTMSNKFHETGDEQSSLKN